MVAGGGGGKLLDRLATPSAHSLQPYSIAHTPAANGRRRACTRCPRQCFGLSRHCSGAQVRFSTARQRVALQRSPLGGSVEVAEATGPRIPVMCCTAEGWGITLSIDAAVAATYGLVHQTAAADGPAAPDAPRTAEAAEPPVLEPPDHGVANTDSPAVLTGCSSVMTPARAPSVAAAAASTLAGTSGSANSAPAATPQPVGGEGDAQGAPGAAAEAKERRRFRHEEAVRDASLVKGMMRSGISGGTPRHLSTQTRRPF